MPTGTERESRRSVDAVNKAPDRQVMQCADQFQSVGALLRGQEYSEPVQLSSGEQTE